MRLVIRPNPDEVAEWVARYVKERITNFKPTAEKPFVIGLPTGGSPLKTYQRLIKYYQDGELSFANVVTFNMDEYVGLDPSHPESYHSFMWNNLFKHVDVLPENVHILDGNAKDLQAECDAYEAKILKYGGIELFLGGIGHDGHMAFNEPGSSLTSRTRCKTLAMDTIVANARFFNGDLSQVPRSALTVGVGTIMDAREVLIIVTGSSKAYALAKAVEGGVSHMWTVSALQTHKRSCIVCDDDATMELRVKTVRYFKGIQETQEDVLGLSFKGYDGFLPTAQSNALTALAAAMKTKTRRSQVKRALAQAGMSVSDISGLTGTGPLSPATPRTDERDPSAPSEAKRRRFFEASGSGGGSASGAGGSSTAAGTGAGAGAGAGSS